MRHALSARLWFAAVVWMSTTSVLGCAPAVVRTRLPSPVVWKKEESLDPGLLQQMLGERDGEAYRVGPGDTLLVAVYEHPELSLSTYSNAGGSGGRPVGLVIDNDGTIQFPLIGSVKVAGKSSEELRAFLQERLAVFVKDPKVTIQVIFNGAIRYYLIGQFNNPGLKYSDRPLRLLEALSLGGSVLLERASLRGSYVARSGKRLPVNFRRLIREGDLGQNIALRTGDVVVVPDNNVEQAFVFAGNAGANNTAARGGAVPFRNGRLNLLQALAQAGYGFRERAQGKLAKTHVIRSDGDRGELFIVNAAKILDGEAAPFELVPGDVVFVPARAITTWNQVLEQLLPTLQTVSGLLTPFVQIRYLEQTGGLTNR
jgi:polysaccharide export outer membrane protein